MRAALCACMAQGLAEGSVGKCSQPAQHSICSPELVSWLQSEFVQLRHTCKPPRYKAVSPKRAVCELTPAIFDITKPSSEVMFGRKNRSVANQN